MSDFVVALGLVLVIEGLAFSAFPSTAKRAMAAMEQTSDNSLRVVGLASAAFGVVLVWLVRG